MPNFAFLGQAPRWYPGFGNLVALPGDVCEFEAEPSDGLWAETDFPATDTSGRSWPISDFQPDVNQARETPRVEATAPVQEPPVVQDTPLPFPASDSQSGS